MTSSVSPIDAEEFWPTFSLQCCLCSLRFAGPCICLALLRSTKAFKSSWRLPFDWEIATLWFFSTYSVLDLWVALGSWCPGPVAENQAHIIMLSRSCFIVSMKCCFAVFGFVHYGHTCPLWPHRSKRHCSRIRVVCLNAILHTQPVLLREKRLEKMDFFATSPISHCVALY